MLRNSGLYILSIVLSCCVDAGFCDSPLESAEVFVLQLSLWSDSGCKFRLSSRMWWCRSWLSAQSPCCARQVCPAHAQLMVSPKTCVVSFLESGNPFPSSLHSGHCTGSSSKKDGLALTVSAVCPSALLCEWPRAPPPRAMPGDTEDSPL